MIDIFLVKSILKRGDRFSFFIWGVIIIALFPFIKGSYTKFPVYNDEVIFSIGFVAILFIISAFFSGYKPYGKTNIIIFTMICPIIEEIIFRGIILPHYTNVLGSEVLFELMNLPITLSIIISAFLFAICHLQYYKYSSLTLRYMIFAFIGGLLLGGIAHLTQSILLTIALHLLSNFTAMAYANWKVRDMTARH